ncbi:coenzyme F420 hydrogenase/dehydrogenase beta subunit N-terminal domain-containing protein [Bradyrhizobium icense]|uniref:coenzyme F420 hydrogenase/dehydrogenase beta subunit N-terminal domain-containing protein n=1 Tax=Bradyrhizobium icense TaxID=1274631 RepID=UPI0009F6626A
MREIHRSWSSEHIIRQTGAAGGILTALGRYLLTSGRVHAVLHVRADDRNPWLTTSTISRTPDGVCVPLSLATAHRRSRLSARLLDEGKLFAVIGKACEHLGCSCPRRSRPAGSNC